MKSMHMTFLAVAMVVASIGCTDVELENDAPTAAITIEFGGTMYEENVGGNRQPTGTRLVGPVRAARGAGALGEHDDPDSLVHQPGALGGHLVPGLGALAAIDMHHVQTPQRPAKERDRQQFPLENIGQRPGHNHG